MSKETKTTLVLKNAGWLWLTEVLTQSLGGFYMILVARYVGPEQYGVYVASLAASIMLLVPAEYGLDMFLAREVSQDIPRGPRLVTTALQFRILLSAAAVGLVFLGSDWIKLERSVWPILFPVLTMNIFLLLKRTLIAGMLQPVEHMKPIPFLLLVEQILKLAGVGISLWLSLTFSQLLWITAIITAFSYGLHFLISARVAFLPALGFWPVEIVHLLKKGLPFMMTKLTGRIYTQADKLILAPMIPAAMMGLYGGAERYNRILLQLPNPIMQALFPSLSKLGTADREKLGNLYGQLIRTYAFFSVAAASCLALSARLVTTGFLGTEYAGAEYFLIAMMFFYPVRVSNNVHGSYFVVLHKEKLLFYLSLAMSILYVGIGYILVYYLGAYGVILGLGFLVIVAFIVNATLVTGYLQFPFPFKEVLKGISLALLGCLPLLFVRLFLPLWWEFAGIAISGLFLLILLFKGKILSKKGETFFGKLLPRFFRQRLVQQ